jgi:hypothetical protein
MGDFVGEFEIFKIGPAGRSHIQYRGGRSAEHVLGEYASDAGRGDLVSEDKVTGGSVIYSGADRIFAIPREVVTEAEQTDPTHPHWMHRPLGE